jgi:hypothetical protein
MGWQTEGFGERSGEMSARAVCNGSKIINAQRSGKVLIQELPQSVGAGGRKVASCR